MSRIADIIKKARTVLADPDKDRWSDDRLLELVSDAQEDIVIKAELLKTSISIPLVVGQAMYTLPEDCFFIRRASVRDREIPIVSYGKLDEKARKERVNNDTSNYWERHTSNSNVNENYINSVWESDEGAYVEALVHDNRSPLDIRVYPIPNSDITVESYTFENGGTVVFAGDERYGVVGSITDYTFDSVYGVVTGMYDPTIASENFDSAFGLVADMGETTEVFTIWYSKLSPELSSVNDALSIPRMYDRALRYFVIAMAFLDDYDTRNVEKSSMHNALYLRELEVAENFTRKNGVKIARHRTDYRSAFE
jgi:hypothetical protein